MKKKGGQNFISTEFIESSIHVIRGFKVMLDEDLATLYGIETKQLNKQVKRNIERFPEDFMFQMSEEEIGFLKSQNNAFKNVSNLRCQIGTSSLESENEAKKDNYETSKPGIKSKNSYGGRRYLPYVFTEQGVAMLSSVLRSSQAVAVNIEIMRTFIKIRRLFGSQEKFNKDLNEVRSFLLKNSRRNDVEFKKVWQAIESLQPPQETPQKIGFRLDMGQ